MTRNVNIRKMTVGDEGCIWRRSDRCFIRRDCIADMTIGEDVLIRFSSGAGKTQYRLYQLAERTFRNDFDRLNKLYTGGFVRVREGASR